MVILGSHYLFRSEQMLRAAHWDHMGNHPLVSTIGGTYRRKQRNKNHTRILIVTENFLSKFKACAVSSHRKINSVFTGKVFMFFHL